MISVGPLKIGNSQRLHARRVILENQKAIDWQPGQWLNTNYIFSSLSSNLLYWLIENQSAIGWNKAQWKSVDGHGHTIAHRVPIQNRKDEIYDILLEYQETIGWGINQWRSVDLEENTIAHLAARYKRLDLVKWIFEYQNRIGWTLEQWRAINSKGETFVDVAVSMENNSDFLNWIDLHGEEIGY